MANVRASNLPRRSLVAMAGAVLGTTRAQATADRLLLTLADAEKHCGGRLGAAILDRQSRRHWLWRSEERFPLTSTFKAFATAAILARVDNGQEDLGQIIRYAADDLVTYSPVTERHLETGMTLADICEAAMTLSDNTAGNLLLRRLGGPAGLTRFMRSIGDEQTRLDRWETELNQAIPGDLQDTTTPGAAAASLSKLVLGDVLSPASRQRLTDWLVADRVGGPLLRSGLPSDWRVGDRTGAGEHGSRAVIAVAWPPHRQPIVAAVYLTGTTLSLAERDAIIAGIGRALAAAV